MSSSGASVTIDCGTLKALATNNAWITSNESGNVQIKEGGARLDTNGCNAGIGVVLAHGGSNRDGGVTKLGLGTLILSGANSYTGLTTVNGGVLELGVGAGAGAHAGRGRRRRQWQAGLRLQRQLDLADGSGGGSKRGMESASFNTNTYKRMVELAKEDEKLAQRMRLLQHRVIEEFYDIQNDPNCLVNLIADPSYKKEIKDLQSALEGEMQRTHDPVLNVFVNRANQNVVDEYMREQKLTERKRREWVQAIKDAMTKDKNNCRNTQVGTEK